MDIRKIIKDLQKDFSGSNEEQMAGVQLLKGLATSEEDIANTFMKKVDQAITKISQELLKEENAEVIEVTLAAQINEDVELEPGDQIMVLRESQMDEVTTIPPRMVKDYEDRAEAERRAGGSIEIDTRLPTVAITLSDGSEFFFQEREASDLLDTVPYNVNEEDFLLATAPNW